MSEFCQFAAPSKPASGATVALFNSVTAFNGAKLMRQAHLTRIQINFLSVSHVSGTGGLIPYKSVDGGTTWYAVDFNGLMPATVAASTTGKDNVYDFWVGDTIDFKVEYTASANTYTTWAVSVTGYFGEVHPAV